MLFPLSIPNPQANSAERQQLRVHIELQLERNILPQSWRVLDWCGFTSIAGLVSLWMPWQWLDMHELSGKTNMYCNLCLSKHLSNGQIQVHVLAAKCCHVAILAGSQVLAASAVLLPLEVKHAK